MCKREESLEEMLGETVYDIEFTDEQVLNYMKYESFEYQKITKQMKINTFKEYERQREESIKDKEIKDFLNFLESQSGSKDSNIDEWYKERKDNYIIVVDRDNFYLIFLYDKVSNTITRSTIDKYIIDSDSLINELNVNNNEVRFTTYSDVIKDMLNHMFGPNNKYDESVSRFWSVFNSL